MKVKMDDSSLINAVGTIIGALIIFLFSVWASRVQKEQGEKDKAEINAANERLKEELKAANAELLAATNRLTKLNNEQHSYHTGGDSYCYLEFYENPLPKQMTVYLCHAGDYPLKGLKIYLTDATFFLDENDPSRRSIVGATQKFSKMFTVDIAGVGYKEKICVLPVPSSDAPLYWVATFETADGKKRWYQRTYFKPYKESKFVKGLPPHVTNSLLSSPHPHKGYSQVYRYFIDEAPGKFKLTGSSQIIDTPTTHTQEVWRESYPPGPTEEFKWFDTHIGYNEQGFFQKVVYLDGAKDYNRTH